ncbi:cytochrome d ubiquinol oxidase subunit II [Friedmanniella endophytica]|uniref:Cytochrome d ubiquinol oxidase subunit II n=1 Tax=Microlunatus kandeliicorticis TaxID=1759536 RepID=A0A7W3IQH0_9ACTN|nr:cytochrome d ubiquinol oxidase subunit II [Microlunatus kandeliicorticis]MBA8793383.1 cytochrome d ubiquinol oxidase subunit II [Microlunatus kandeliicorticis]
MELHTVWFALIAFLWTGYFVLEGFDFGVGTLVGVLGRDDRERRQVINTIGPHFDANEVWVIVAAGAMFAAFPDWYATVFSGFYLLMLAILVALIVRLVGIDYRSKRPEAAWRRRWDVAITVSSAAAALLWGIAFGNVVAGVPVDARGELVGSPGALLRPFPLLSGLAVFALCVLHGAVFVALKTDGEVRVRAARLARRFGPVVVLLVAGTLGSLVALRAGGASATAEGRTAPGLLAALVLSLVAVLALAGALLANRRGREGWAFVGTAVTVGAMVAAWFVGLFPAVLPSTLDPAWSLTVTNASSTDYTLTIMTWAAAVATPFVLAYQAWSYWVFRRRLRVTAIPVDH